MCPSYDSFQIRLDIGKVLALQLVQDSESSFERRDKSC